MIINIDIGNFRVLYVETEYCRKIFESVIFQMNLSPDVYEFYFESIIVHACRKECPFPNTRVRSGSNRTVLHFVWH